jgi:hypothetical protein
MTAAQKALVAQARASAAILERAGFRRIWSTVAGLDSGSGWQNESTGQTAQITVRNGNRITYGE